MSGVLFSAVYALIFGAVLAFFLTWAGYKFLDGWAISSLVLFIFFGLMGGFKND